MNTIRKSLSFLPQQKRGLEAGFFCRFFTNDPVDVKVSEDEKIHTPILHRKLNFMPIYDKPREVWVENMDSVKEEKRGIVELHPKIFGSIPRLDLIFNNVKWQILYRSVELYGSKSKAEMRGGGRKPHPQKGTGKARQGSIRNPHMIGGGLAHGPRAPTSHFYMLSHGERIHGLVSTFSAKLAQDDIHVVENLEIPTADEQFMHDLVKERCWGTSVLFADSSDIMPRNITAATDQIGHMNLMPVYGLNVYSMLKHETLVLTVSAVDEIEERLLTILNSANYNSDHEKYDKHN